VWLDGTNPTLRTESEQVRVVSGALHFSSSSMPAADLDVPEGSCLVDSGAEAPEHELLGSLAVGACQ
jgi:hypothetical protein